MIYKNLIKNNNTLNELLLFYKKNKLPNAFIFHGNDGVGKEAHAIEFFGLLNCSNSKVDNACGNCNSCKKIKILQHELLHIITPLPKSKSLSKNEHPLKALNEKQKSNLIDLYKSKGKDPYFKIKLEGANRIILNSIKEIKKTISLSIPQKKIRVFLILNAEKLCFPNQESANALLKILEEPKENNLFILVTSEINKIIPTIKSRCTKIYFNNLKSKQIENCLINLNISNAKIISKIADGNIYYALKIKDSITLIISSIEKMLSAITSFDIDKWNNEFQNKNKDEIIDNLKVLNLFFRDLKLVKENNDFNFIIFNKFESYYLKLLKKFKKINLSHIIKNIENTQNYINMNGYAKLMISGLFIEITKDFKNKHYSQFKIESWVSHN